MQVLLESFERNPADGTFRCLLTTLQSDILCEIKSHSRTESTTLDILQNVVSLSIPRKSRKMQSICLLSKIPKNAEDTVDHRFRLCCKILINNAKDLLDGLPFNRKNAFDHCMIQNSPEIYGDWKPMDFYEHVHLPSADEAPFDSQSTDKLLEALQCQLYPFQKRALQWLLRREGVHIAGGNVVRCTSTDPETSLPHGFIRTEDADGADCFISHCLGIVTKHRSLLKNTTSHLRGGILAEEMGLGKTVEIIALISLHKRGSASIADFSISNESTVASSATLIITPPAILEQWKNEIGAIAPYLKVSIYEGIRTDAKTHDDEQRVARLAEQGVFLMPILSESEPDSVPKHSFHKQLVFCEIHGPFYYHLVVTILTPLFCERCNPYNLQRSWARNPLCRRSSGKCFAAIVLEDLKTWTKNALQFEHALSILQSEASADLMMIAYSKGR